MLKTTLITAITTMTLLLSSSFNPVLAGEFDRDSQRVCAFIDKKASNSRWTRRDETAKMRFYAEFKIDRYYDNTKHMGSNRQIEMTYGESPKCENVIIQDDHLGIVKGDGTELYWKFTEKFKVGLQYGGDCEFYARPGKTIYVTIHHRRGDLVNPWSCYVH